jgi:starch synthase
MKRYTKKPRILIVTPEITYLPAGMGNMANYLTAKAGGLADVSASLVAALYDQGADVHVALPDYRQIFNSQLAAIIGKERKTIQKKIPEERLHLAQDRAFYYIDNIYSSYNGDNTKVALAFQREVINNIVPKVNPDLIHCNDWMTGLIPAMSRNMGIPCLFTVHNIFSMKMFLYEIEDNGIDAALFWQELYYENMAATYEQTREHNRIDFLTSGIFAAHFVNTVSPFFLEEVVAGKHGFIDNPIKVELTNKFYANCAEGILNTPDPSFNPSNDTALAMTYSSDNHIMGKRENKRILQKKLNLVRDIDAPVFFWPSRLDTIQKGCNILAEILYKVISRYWNLNMEIVFVGNGDFQKYFHEIVWFHQFSERVAVCDFDEDLSRLAYAASDFILMPSRFEPCGLPQMIAPIYGSLPVAHDTGGIHDTISHINIEHNKGNGFLFETHDSNGLVWAIEQAIAFHMLPQSVKKKQIKRIMEQSLATFNHDETASEYIKLYEKMLQRPLVT